MNAIILRSDKKLEGHQVEVDKGSTKDQGEEIVREKENSSLDGEEQDKHEETTKPN